MAIPVDEDVEKTLTRIMSQQSPLMKQARTQGLQSAQQAGLGQSTMGIQAAQAAAYNAAMPIASQQTQQAHQRGLQTEQFGQQTAMQKAEFGQQTGMQTAQFGHESGLQQAGFGHAATQAELDRQQQIAQLNRQAELDRQQTAVSSFYNTQEANVAAERQKELNSQQYGFESNMKLLDRQTQERLTSMELNAADRERAATSFMNIEGQYAQAFAQISGNENLPADVRDAYLTHIGKIRESNTNMTSALYRSTGTIPW